MPRVTQYNDQKIAVLKELDGRARRHSQVPTVRELAELFDTSPATMHSWISKLGKEGLVEWTPGRHRSLRLSPTAIQLLSSQGGQSA